ncbi:NAD(P)H-dependent glycerol-3-phosphate dehydrogenase [Thalassococcus lentus]|uniref:Glycerol-3-phosphate dehydrogenase [NAD(P)+] n=1 Tax=Thalassococcus lentus TaxID=1210524 RepID=A0ABT4XNF3_9RHOB|nr:NAD(P)H-dependent glycerol-3-phosphate dehydrogenase [Thalassococcus lentus]MDA7423477.1 NAD(P)-dependent glycerol-3-phosphate dehydrogenase [Thalassococcus lentus]
MSVSILGGGAFGTALAVAIGQQRPVTIWARNPETLLSTRQSPRLPGVSLPDAVTVNPNLKAALGADVILFSMPMQSLTGFAEQIEDGLTGKALVACCKGIDLNTLRGPTDILAQQWPDATAAVLTGPSFAVDIANGLPTALTLACRDDQLGIKMQEQLSTRALRLYRTVDVTGAELGGALKNVIAIACGACIGQGLGDSARAALMTRGFAEIARLAQHLGADPSTLAGLSGFGDLVLTCTSEKSRNYRFGQALGRGETFDDDTTVEGVKTAAAVTALARKLSLEMPICEAVQNVSQGASVTETIQSLLNRPLKEE